ncbi:MAG: PP2C family protein-serine/threonine phosphatase [Terracidiphilus sp.]
MIFRRIAMRLLSRLFLLLTALLALGTAAHAQNFDATHLHGPMDLGVTWLVHAGDDPAYAQPGFDDSQWLRFNPSASLKNVIKNGHPSVIWYRLHVKVDPSQTGLSLLEWGISPAFEIYVNGQRLMTCGRVDPFEPHTESARLLRRIPDQQIATGRLVIALRVYISKFAWANAAPGLYAANLTIGQETSLREHAWLAVIGDNLFHWVNWFAGLGLGIVALALFAAQRRQKEYLWIFLQFACVAASIPLLAYEFFHTVPSAWDVLTGTLGLLQLFFYVLTFFAILNIRFKGWFRIFFAAAAIGMAFSMVAQVNESLPGSIVLMAGAPMAILLGGVLPILLVIHWRRGNPEAGILLIPAIVSSLLLYVEVALEALFLIPAMSNVGIRADGLIYHFQVGPIVLDWNSMAQLLYVLSLAIIIILRSTRISRQQAQLEAEVAAAQEVQQVILPEQVDTVPGLLVETVYKPAQQVGGDFFQIIPGKADGSLLIVAGDVTGKGLKAGMLVALLVGAIRSTAETTRDPLAMLEALNRRLLGRGDAQATCLALRIAKDGAATLANAGHLPPYKNGEPLAMEGALPLGMMDGAAFSVAQFQFSSGDRLVLISDGVVEATDTHGALFGFDRVHELLRTTGSAEQVASAAQVFGQEDDISVISITCGESLAAALA